MKTKIADSLVPVQTLLYYDFPLMEHMRDPSNGQDFILVWIDETPEMVMWHTIKASPETLAKYLSRDPLEAITFKALMLASPAIYRCSANTYNYGEILEGELVPFDQISDEIMPTDDSYHDTGVMKYHEEQVL